MKIEIRSNSVHISGYVNAVERDSRVLPPAMASEATRDFVEQVASGAFSRAISRRNDIKLKFNHGRDIGSTAGKTLTLKEDNIGLHADGCTRGGRCPRQRGCRSGEKRRAERLVIRIL